MKARGQPRAQARLGGTQIDAGHAYLGKSERTRPLAHLRQQLVAIQFLSFDHLPVLETRGLIWPDEPACAATAHALARRQGLRSAIVELRGPLGAGKTTFARYLLQALGVQGRIKSPTYAVMEPYELPDGTVWHFDFYRFKDPQEWEDAGFRDVYASAGLKLAEWPEQAAGLLPQPDLCIAIAFAQGNTREACFAAYSALGLDLLP